MSKLALINRKFLFLLFFHLFFFNFSFAQLSDFTLQVASTNETCTANGTLTFTVSGITAGASVTYSVYKLPDLITPVAVLNTSTLNGLTSGTYTVIATQTFGALSNSQVQTVDIQDLTVVLTYQLIGQNELCGSDGVISVNVLTGTAQSYEIISGPVTVPLQTTNVFTGLTGGTYVVRVFDVCGDASVQTFILFSSQTSLTVEVESGAEWLNCTTSTVALSVLPGNGMIVYPLTIQFTINPPNANQIIINQTINSLGEEYIIVQGYQIFDGETYSYSYTITDACGNEVTGDGSLTHSNPSPAALELEKNCEEISYYINHAQSATIISAPATYLTNAIPYTMPIGGNGFPVTGFLVEGNYVITGVDICGNDFQLSIQVQIPEPEPPTAIEIDSACQGKSYFIDKAVSATIISAPDTYTTNTIPYILPIGENGFPITGYLSPGTYTLLVLDSCDNEFEIAIIVSNPNAVAPIVFVIEGCEVGFGSLNLNGINTFQSVVLITAPQSFPFPLPYNVSSNININGDLILTGLPAGDYVFEWIDVCGAQSSSNVTIQGYSFSTNVEVFENCGSFDLGLYHTSNNFAAPSFWLQKYDPVSGNWGHPLTGVVYVDGTQLTATNSINLMNNTINYNLPYFGQFRIMKRYQVVSNGNIAQYCNEFLYEFEFTGLPRINNIYSFSCGNNLRDVIVDASGVPPLLYRIIEKNGNPFLIENANSTTFLSLEIGIYTFQIEDSCGNLRNSEFEISESVLFEIVPSSICIGETVTLLTPNFSFLTYQWWLNDNSSVIISTSNSLVIPNYSPALHNGVYHVLITNPNNPSSCINLELEFEINSTDILPEAGEGSNETFCGPQATLDLFTFLSGTYSTAGVWTEITTSGTLNQNNWDTSNLSPGEYQFTYRVEGNCDSFDESFVNITILETPESPIASVDSLICESNSVQLYATTIPDAVYQWVGPNGFSSNEQNPIIDSISSVNNGTYTVSIETNGCPSTPSSVEVLVSEVPEFSLENLCINDRMMVTASHSGQTLDNPNLIFSWTGPNGFTSSQNPIDITGLTKGIYTLTITNEFGCSAEEFIDITKTICTIPKGLSPNGDGLNDTFDLTDLGENLKVKIYNRYGMVVYELDGYVNQWRGQDKRGNLLPSATYYYYVEFDNGEGRTGWVYLTTTE
ncbi:gliding motility-associated C-terminal domain-containing protein [Flavobacterium azooxidireducens]|uniref:Gliding motility-associated C-terminal domain-containing protein n=1 Tax=Flavobacterium azooxidireducens TaxID=1871076 RepID=A0ABY4KER8_9FLAO|nr:gliding motility-associated C-terminal domain-containing protein [Flavobacterium azooxidireducens]UPQ77890.1 gliding motility-associated C-terminal domain-containing protein [Flavobacterium azooxidireducens]